MNITDALSGRARLDGVRWLLLSPASHRILTDQLKALLSSPDILGPCRLLHARFRPDYKLTAYYDVGLQLKDHDVSRARPITVTWRSNGNTVRRQGSGNVAAGDAEALHRGVAAPFRQLLTDVSAQGMQIQVSPLDERFPHLVRMSDPWHVRDIFTHISAGACTALRRPTTYIVTSIRYRPGKRHILRYDSLDAPEQRSVFAKFYSGEDGARVARVAKQAADWLTEHVEGVAAVRPLAYLAEDAVVLYPRVSGVPLSDHLCRPSRGLAEWLKRAGSALRALHRLPETVVGPLRSRDFTAEVQEIAQATDHIPALLPSVAVAINVLRDRALELHERLPKEPATFTHGDFKSEHLWVASGGLTLIDFDSSRLADPALDIGKLLADLQLLHPANDQRRLKEQQEWFLAGYGTSGLTDRLMRARLYEVIELLKMTVRRVRLFERDWASRTARLVGRAQAVMNDLQVTIGLPAKQQSFHGSIDVFETRRPARAQSHRSRARGGWS